MKDNLENKIDLENETHNEKSPKKIKKVILIIMIIIILISAFFYYMRFIETNKLKVKEIKVENTLLPNEFHGLKIVQFSDLHYLMTTNNEYIEKLVDKINYINPDIVAFTGDLLDENVEYTSDDYNNLIDILSKIETNNKYYIKGNHDYFNDKVDIILKNSNFIDLNNTYDYYYKSIDSKIVINGLGSLIQRDNNKEEAFNYDNNIYTITLIHEPDLIDEIIEYNPNIVIAGHTHNGQINVPYIKDLFKVNGCKKYYESEYQINNTKLYINSGIGTSILKYRLFNPPTINFYRVISN